jgi:hypothetical protein
MVCVLCPIPRPEPSLIDRETGEDGFCLLGPYIGIRTLMRNRGAMCSQFVERMNPQRFACNV